jgi:multimeric flavodoxin WrbA
MQYLEYYTFMRKEDIMMKITAIIGSPRKTGNTSTIVEAMLEGAKEEHVETAVHYLGEKTVKGCIGCYSCRETSECVIKDDMREIYNDINDSDVLVFASPIYFYTVTGQFKTFIDRSFPYYWEKPLKGKKAVLALTWANSNPDMFNDTVDWFKRITDAMQIDLVETITVSNTGSNPVAENKELLHQFRKIGLSLTQK